LYFSLDIVTVFHFSKFWCVL